jgi:hypothetical protein
MGLAVVGFILLILGALVTFAGKRIFEAVTKLELSISQEMAFKSIGLVIVVAGSLLIFRFGR